VKASIFVNPKMTDKQGKEQQSYKSDASNVDLQDQHHSTGFYHSETKNFDENHEPVDKEKDSTCMFSLEERFNENEFSNFDSNANTKLKYIRKLFLIAKGQKVNLSAVTSLQNHIQTCIVTNVHSAPNWNEESNAIYMLTNLRHLELISCEMIELHDAISKLTSLQTFLLWSSPKLNRLPISMSKLTSLRCLSLTATNINVDDAIIVVTKLSSLQILKMSAKGDPTQSEISKFKPLQVSDIIGNNLTSLPTQISHLTTLQTLDLSYNQLTVLPTQIGHLTALQQLNLSYNQLTVLPTHIGHLTALQQLDLLGNHLTVLPTLIGHLTALQKLYLSDNHLTTLPTQIGHLTALHALYLNNNQLTTLPTQIGHLTALHALYLNNNQLTTLPTQIGHLIALQQLSLNSNHRFLFIPSELGMLSSLWVLRFEGTNVTFIPPVPLEQLALNRSLKFPPSSRTNYHYTEFVEVYNDLY